MDATEPEVDHQGVDEPPEELYQYDRTVNKRVSTIGDVTEEDLGFFQEHGYLVVDELLDREEVEAARDGLLDLLAGKVPDFDGVQYEGGLVEALDDPDEVPPEVKQDYVRKFMWFADHDERLGSIAAKPELLDLLDTLVGGEPEMFQDMALLKPPGGGREKPWHQDKAYFDVSLDAPVVGVWIALDEATAENGCMHLIPGSHHDGPVVHFDRRDWQICDTDVQVDRDVMAPLEPGGALLFDGLLHHGTPPNRSEKRRRALQFHYTAADAEWLDERPEVYDSDGKDVYC
jgi:phytanoyl-CoA hydroxylase